MLSSGVYLLALWLSRPARLRVGRLGCLRFPAGLYLYAGSARRALAGRLARHRRRAKRARWHVDCLRRRARFLGAAVVPWAPGRECALARAALAAGGARMGPRGFGSSDCDCPTHLAYLGERPGRPGAPGTAEEDA